MLMFLMGDHYYPDANKEGNEQMVNTLVSVSIIAAAISQHSVFNFEFALLKYLGKISYGIYVFHIFAVRVVYHVLMQYGDSPWTQKNPVFHFLFPFGATLLAILLSAVSYELLEKPFLKLKSKFK